MTRIVREMPYFETPCVRAPVVHDDFRRRATPISLAMAGMKRCISPYSRSGLTTSARNTFSEQP